VQLQNPFLLSKYMNEAFRNYHGSLLAYDDGLARGDTVLASALHRNFFLQQEHDGQFAHLEHMVRYVHHSLYWLSLHSSEAVLAGIVHLPTIAELPPIPAELTSLLRERQAATSTQAATSSTTTRTSDTSR